MNNELRLTQCHTCSNEFRWWLGYIMPSIALDKVIRRSQVYSHGGALNWKCLWRHRCRGNFIGHQKKWDDLHRITDSDQYPECLRKSWKFLSFPLSFFCLSLAPLPKKCPFFSKGAVRRCDGVVTVARKVKRRLCNTNYQYIGDR